MTMLTVSVRSTANRIGAKAKTGTPDETSARATWTLTLIAFGTDLTALTALESPCRSFSKTFVFSSPYDIRPRSLGDV